MGAQCCSTGNVDERTKQDLPKKRPINNADRKIESITRQYPGDELEDPEHSMISVRSRNQNSRQSNNSNLIPSRRSH